MTPSPNNPLGLKGVGEAGTIGATPAVANAVMDALHPLGIRHLDLPKNLPYCSRLLSWCSLSPLVAVVLVSTS